jgi:hypothetical protein
MSINDESQYLERTPDMVAKVRVARAEAQNVPASDGEPL